MKVWGLTESCIRDTLAAVSVHKYQGNLMFNRQPERDGRAIIFTIRCVSSKGPGHRMSQSWSHRMVAACWHAHRDVMRALFDAGATRIKTAVADYRSEADFEAKYRATGSRNIGSMFYPVEMQDACECD